MIGETFSHYTILEKLGEGGMGVVYLAEDHELERKVALKFLPEEFASDPEALSRFKREARAAAALSHPNIVTVHEVGEHEGRSYIVMAFVDGEPLAGIIGRKDLPLKKIADIAIQIGDGLSSAHEAGVIHRDVKPGNILIGTDGRVKILDFGLAKLKGASKLTQETSTLGTLNYMSPEQARGEEVDHRSDIFSFGAVLYEMITGQVPFRGDHAAAVMYSIASEAPQPLQRYNRDASDDLERIVFKALAKKPGDRYQHMSDLVVDLKAFERSLEVGAVRPVGRRSRTARWALLIGAAAAVLAAFIIGRSFLFSPKTEAASSIAVLPLENLSGDPAEDYFVDGMTEALIADLAKIGALKVISRTSVMRFKGTDKSVPEIARELDVGNVVEGSALRVGDRVRITAQLIEARTDRHLWAESYERDVSDVLALQGEMARTIAGEIKIRLTPTEEASLSQTQRIDPEAYEAYLKGRYHWNKRTKEDVEKSVRYFERAIGRDPVYATAYVGLAEAYTVMGMWGYITAGEAAVQSEKHAMRAIEIDDGLGSAYSVLGGVAWYRWRWEESEALFRKAIDLSPNYATAHQWYAELLSDVQRHDEALEEMRRALKLDPLSLVMNASMGALYYYARRYDEAIEQCNKVLDMQADFWMADFYLWQAYLQKKMYKEAVEHFEKCLIDNEKSQLMAVYEASGIEGVYRWIASAGETITYQTFNRPYLVAMAHALLGETEETLKWLEEVYETGSGFFARVPEDPAFDNIRSDPGYSELLLKVGLNP